MGFTERQARFLVTAILHSGVCVPRQYARFAGIVHGQKTRKFFAKLVRLEYASMHDCRHNRAVLYHLDNRRLYRAVGDAESRLRRPLTLGQAVHRLMVLDAIVEDPDLVWLATAEEKAAHLKALTRIDQLMLPHVTAGEGERRVTRYFPERLPIGIHPAGRGVLVYVVADPWPGRVPYLPRASRGPGQGAACMDPSDRCAASSCRGRVSRAKQVVRNQLLTPLPLEVIDELRCTSSRCEAIQHLLDATTSTSGSTGPAPRTQHLGSRRCTGCGSQDGDMALSGVGLHAIEAAVAAGAGRVETLELGHRYGHLSPLVNVA